MLSKFFITVLILLSTAEKTFPVGLASLRQAGLAESDDPSSDFKSDLATFEADSTITIDGIIITVTNDPLGGIVVETNNGSVVLEKGTSYEVVDEAGNGYLIDEEGNITKTTATDALLASERGSRQYTSDPNLKVTFNSTSQTRFGFDQPQEILQQNYQRTDNGDLIAWKALSATQADEIGVSLPSGIERGKLRYEISPSAQSVVPISSDGDLDKLSLSGKSNGAIEELLALYSESDTSDTDLVAGKLNMVSYEVIRKKLVIIRVNGSGFDPGTTTLQEELNGIYSQAVVEWTVENPVMDIVVNGIDANNLDDGGSGLLSNYTDDMKKVLRKFTDNNILASETYYLFIVTNSTSKNKLGYMPRHKQAGFIFPGAHSNSSELTSTIAHELGHGAFHLQHIFSEMPVSPGATENLMDYPAGTRLDKFQWDHIHNPETVIGLFEGDEEGALVATWPSTILVDIEQEQLDLNSYGFITPSNIAIGFSELTQVELNYEGALYGFTTEDGTKYSAIISTNGLEGYIDNRKISEKDITAGELSMEMSQYISENRFPLVELQNNKWVYIKAKEQIDFSFYADCTCAYRWPYHTENRSIYGPKLYGAAPINKELLSCAGSECQSPTVQSGAGMDLYLYVTRNGNFDGDDKFEELCNYFSDTLTNKSFAFYGYGMESYGNYEIINSDIKKFFLENQIFSREAFDEKFPYKLKTWDKEVVFSNIDLWDEIDIAGYNLNSRDYTEPIGTKYEYSFADLKTRHNFKDVTTIFTYILNLESQGKATGLSQQDGVEQYVGLYDTYSALFFWMQNYFIEIAEPATFVHAGRALARFRKIVPIKKTEEQVLSELDVFRNRKELNKLNDSYLRLAPDVRLKVEFISNIEDIAIAGDDASGDIIILARKSDEEVVEVGRVANGDIVPSQYLDTGSPIGEAVDGHQLVKNGDEVGFLAKGGDKSQLLAKLDNFPNVKTWVSSFDNVADASLIAKVDGLDPTDLGKLNTDIIHSKYGTEIKTLLTESPDDLTNIWKRLKDDPAYSWELQKTGDSRREKWSQREFFKDVTAKGKGFETDVCLATFKNRSSAKYLELKNKISADFGKNLDDYDMYSQVQLKYDGDNYFVADQLFVRYKTVAGQKVVDDVIVIENKLSSTTPLTTPQADAFQKNTFTVRSISSESEFVPNTFLNQNTILNFSSSKQWYKVHDGANGDVISGIQKMQ